MLDNEIKDEEFDFIQGGGSSIYLLYGNEYYCVDETLRSRLEAKLLRTILGFKLVR